MSELTTLPEQMMEEAEARPQPFAALYALDWEKILYVAFVILAIISPSGTWATGW